MSFDDLLNEEDPNTYYITFQKFRLHAMALPLGKTIRHKKKLGSYGFLVSYIRRLRGKN